MGHGINLGVVSQTPVIRFKKEINYEISSIDDIGRDDYNFTVGGVTPLLMSQLKGLLREGVIKRAEWYSLNPNAPKRIKIEKNIEVINISLEERDSQLYTSFKQKVWNAAHNIHSGGFGIDEYVGYLGYNADLVQMMLKENADVDLFEIHDFQQLLVGSMIGPSFPSVFRWHIPFKPDLLPLKIRKFIINGIEGNDAVIVSTRRDLEGLIRAGFKGRAYQVYPHLDPAKFTDPKKSEVSEFCDKYGIKPDDFLIINVARMDRIKSQDDLIKAVAKIKNKEVKLMLIGNGSFTSETLGHSGAYSWRKKLEGLVRTLKLEKRVIFAGYMADDYLRSAYKRANLLVLPSKTEGFGLVAVEAWLYNTPAVVSRGAGVSELIIEGLNGLTYPPGDVNDLSRKINKILRNSKLKKEMGVNAHRMAKACYVSTAIPILKEIYKQTIDDFG